MAAGALAPLGGDGVPDLTGNLIFGGLGGHGGDGEGVITVEPSEFNFR